MRCRTAGSRRRRRAAPRSGGPTRPGAPRIGAAQRGRRLRRPPMPPRFPASRPAQSPAGPAPGRIVAIRSVRADVARGRGPNRGAPQASEHPGLYSALLMANETIDDPRLEEGVWTQDPETGELIPDYESTFPTINEGEVVHGTVVRVDKDEVLVDIGYKSEGVIPVSELSIRRSVNPADEVTVGDEIAALVMTKEDAEGRLILSKKRARFELAWKAIETAYEQGDPVTGRV